MIYIGSKHRLVHRNLDLFLSFEFPKEYLTFITKKANYFLFICIFWLILLAVLGMTQLTAETRSDAESVAKALLRWADLIAIALAAVIAFDLRGVTL